MNLSIKNRISLSKVLFNHPVFDSSIEWLAMHSHKVECGIYKFDTLGWYVNVHEYHTEPRSRCKWENHLQTIDVQYIIRGEEYIDVTESSDLNKPSIYSEDIDTQLFKSKKIPFTTVYLKNGTYTIFLPGEAHRPRIKSRESVLLRKAVVKIPINLVF